MCSTYKLLTAAAILARVDLGQLRLDQRVAYGRVDLLAYAPITRQHLDTGFMTLEALCAAAVTWSDNTAANLLLGVLGGPAGWTHYARSLGDTISRLDRKEPDLNSATPGDPRDTTTPASMCHDLIAVLRGDALSEQSRRRLTAWLLDNTITGTLLRAGMPKGWRVADKSGAGEQGTRNDIGLLLPPVRPPLVAAVYYTGSPQPPAGRDRVIAEVGAIIARIFGAT